MSLVDFYLRQTELTSHVRKQMLKDVSDEDGHWQPALGVPPIAWHVGHLATTEAATFLLMGKGEADEQLTNLLPFYRMGVHLPDDLSGLPRLSELAKLSEPWRERVIAFVKSLSADELNSELPNRMPEGLPDMIRTYADCLTALGVHEGHHNGEISLLRRLKGKAGLF